MNSGWSPKQGDRVVRRPRYREVIPTTIRELLPRPPTRGLASPFTIIYGVGGLILLGGVLLSLPFATTGSGYTPFTTALFTVVSAVTVTGLTVVETQTYWNSFGHAVIFGMILLGGIGWMTLAGLLLIILGQRITLSQRMAFRESIGTTQMSGIVSALPTLVFSTLLLQGIAGIIMGMRFKEAYEWGWGKALWQGLFHAVSGFNNAGFTIIPDSDSLASFQSDYFILTIMTVLIMLGGISFAVMADVVRVRRIARFSLDTKIVLGGSIFLWLIGAAVVFSLEYGNELTLGPMSVGTKVLHSIFQSVTARAAGFSTISFGSVGSATAFFVIGLMFIGTSSASAGGGIRLNTFGVLIATVLSSLRGKAQVVAFGREIGTIQVQRAMTVTTLAIALVFAVAFFLTFTERSGSIGFMDLLFEAVSAVGTVGLSTGTTPELSELGRLFVIGTMILGRVGPMILVLSLMYREQQTSLYRYAGERVRIG